ncbi:MAG TPA: GNAT family N-acetyltransferase [Candidatus Bathyarchaeia archaeon]|nr:GNAT family N-acetyltransferase [Candidatus Bathyarchaeia archaeon]
MSGFTEKEFYLDEFRARTLVVGIDGSALESASARRRLRDVVAQLVANRSRVVVVLGDPPRLAPADDRSIRSWLGLEPDRPRRRSRPLRGEPAPRARGDTVVWTSGDPERHLGEIWQVLRVRSLCVVLSSGSALAVAGLIAGRLRAHKLVIVDPAGGLVDEKHGQTLSVLDLSRLGVLLLAGEAEFQGLSRRHAMLEHAAKALESGVGSVNLCKLDGLARELFTYEGAGTLFTRGDYCVVERLSIDDFHEVERLVERGQREGMLKTRDAAETSELLLSGYGAWVGRRHLAGVGALRHAPYREDCAAEVSGLYTLTRFKGEGIGDSLVKHLVADARAEKLRYVFAVTTVERAAAFFVREGFRRVGSDEVPEVKWRDYDPARQARATVFRLDLDAR